MDFEKVVELETALRTSKLYPGPAIFKYLSKKGYTADDIMARKGFMFVLIDILSEEYDGSIEKLIEAIKKS